MSRGLIRAAIAGLALGAWSWMLIDAMVGTLAAQPYPETPLPALAEDESGLAFAESPNRRNEPYSAYRDAARAD